MTLALDTTASLPGLETRALHLTARIWFAVTTLGLWIFGAYILKIYGGSIVMWNLETWNKVLFYGYIPGDFFGNLALAAHVTLALIITVGGPLQLMPQLRGRFPKFHRMTGRAYMASAFIVAGAGVFLNFYRGNLGGQVAITATTLNAVFIGVCAAVALRYAIKRDIETHKRWALRLFIVVAGVWYFRIGMSFWLLTVGPVGIDMKTFTGPFLTFLNYAQFLLPLLILEAYFVTKRRNDPRATWTMTGLLAGATTVLAIGIVGATMIFWLPHF